jgi:hypothetical protein
MPTWCRSAPSSLWPDGLHVALWTATPWIPSTTTRHQTPAHYYCIWRIGLRAPSRRLLGDGHFVFMRTQTRADGRGHKDWNPTWDDDIWMCTKGAQLYYTVTTYNCRINYSTEMRPPWKADSRSAAQKIPRPFGEPCSQEPATGPCTEQNESGPHTIFKIHFNIIFPSTPRSPIRLPPDFPTKICISHFPMRATIPPISSLTILSP